MCLPSPRARIVNSDLFKPSALTLATCLSTTFICFLLYASLVTPANIAKWSPFLSTYNGDDDIYLTAEILKLRSNAFTEPKPSLYLLGDSSIREAIYENELKTTLANSGITLPIVDLRSGGQSILETLAVIAQLPATKNGYIVTGISVRKLIVKQNSLQDAVLGTRRGFTSSSVDRLLTEAGHPARRRTGFYSIDNFSFLMPRLGEYFKNPFKDPITRVVHQSTIKNNLNEKDLRKQEYHFARSIKLNFDEYMSQLELGKTVLNEIVRLSNKKGYILVLLESPLNPAYVKNQLSTEFYANYIIHIRNYLDQLPIRPIYHNPKLEIDLNEHHFRDIIHLSDEAAIRDYTLSVAHSLTGVMKHASQ